MGSSPFGLIRPDGNQGRAVDRWGTEKSTIISMDVQGEYLATGSESGVVRLYF